MGFSTLIIKERFVISQVFRIRDLDHTNRLRVGTWCVTYLVTLCTDVDGFPVYSVLDQG